MAQYRILVEKVQRNATKNAANQLQRRAKRMTADFWVNG